jgi:hypothetical protein
MNQPSPIDTLMLALESMAREQILTNQDSLPPTWILINAKGESQIEMTPWNDDLEKAIAEVFIKIKMLKQQTKSYAFATEAWMAMAPPGWDPESSEPLRASNHPDKKECVVMFATDGQEKRWLFWEIERDDRGKALRLEPNRQDGWTAEGWMGNLLT